MGIELLRNFIKCMIINLHSRTISGGLRILRGCLCVFLLFVMYIKGEAQTPGGISLNLSSWFKANTQVAGNILPNNNNNTAVSDWKSELAGTTLSQTTSTKQPLFQTTATASGNFNFNPFIQFNTANVTNLTTSSTSPDLLGQVGTVFLVGNTFPGSSTNPTAFTYMSATDYRYQVKPGFRMQTGAISTGYTADFYPALMPATAPDASGYIMVSKGTGSIFRGRKNADSVELTNLNDPVYFPVVSPGMYLGSNGFSSEPYNGGIAEVITYNSTLTDVDINKVESYLALKYAVTLSQNSAYGAINSNYTAAGGITFWDAVANIGYGKCITGIGRDDVSALLQKQSKSVHDSSLVYIYNGTTGGIFPASNVINTSAIATNVSFLLFGDNGLNKNLTACAFNGKMGRMNRVWKVQKTGTIGTVTIAVDQTDVAASAKTLLVSTDPLFPQSATAVYPLLSANGKLYAELSLNSNEYFTFASDSLKVQFNITNPSCTAPAAGSVTATVTGGIPTYTYSWNTTPVQTTATATGLGSGTYTLTVTHNGTCPASYPVILTAPVAPVLLAVAAPPTICNGSNTTLTATVISGTVATYTWSPGGQTGSSITVSPTATTTYIVTGDDGTGCTGTASVVVTVNPKPTAVFTVNPVNACIGTIQTVTFTGAASAAATYNWNFGGATIQSGSGAGPYTILYASAGAYNIQLQVTDNSCSSATTIQPVTVSASPAISFSVSRSLICAGDTVTVSFNGTPSATATPVWNWGGGIIQSGSGFGPYIVKYTATGTVTLTVNDGACSSTAASKLITIIPKPVAVFTPTITAGCVPLLVQFNNASTNADAYQWTFGDGGISVASNPPYTYNTAGLYTVQLVASSQGLCYDTLKRTNLINIQVPPVASFTSVPGINTATELHLANFAFTNTSQNASSYTWQFGDGITSATTSPTHQFALPGNYEVTLIAASSVGCVDTFSLKYYTIIPDNVLIIPNAFSPNGDGINDKWEIDGLKAYPACTVDIFNRWGQSVYSSTGYQYPWDGKYSGKPVPVATYYYVIKTALKSYNGWVVLIR